MKKFQMIFLAVVITVMCAACGAEPAEELTVEPQASQMKSICELATMKCYYHNVAKFTEENAGGILLWKKDKNFWIEYSGIVTIGIDASLVTIEVNDTNVKISIPEAEIQRCEVDESSLTENSYIVAKNSAKVTAEDEVYAFDQAQTMLEETARNDKTLLADAQQRAMSLLEDYVNNFGDVVGKEYSIEWVYVDQDGDPVSTSDSADASA